MISLAELQVGRWIMIAVIAGSIEAIPCQRNQVYSGVRLPPMPDQTPPAGIHQGVAPTSASCSTEGLTALAPPPTPQS